MFYEVLMEKQAKKEQAKEDKGKNYALGATGVIGGAAAAKGSTPLISGRRTFYHGTSAERADAIRKSGLKPQPFGGQSGVTDLAGSMGGSANFSNVDDHDKQMDLIKKIRKTSDPDELAALKEQLPRGRGGKYHSYLAMDKGIANRYANQQRALSAGEDLMEYQTRLAMNPMEALRESGSARPGADVVKIRLPYSLEKKFVENPEAQQYIDEIASGDGHPLERLQKKQFVKVDKKTQRVMPGAIDPEHIVGSDKFKRHNLAEFADYVKQNKGRFAKGIALGGLGLTAGALGARHLYRTYKKSKNSKQKG